MGFGIYALVLFLTMDLSRVEGQHPVVLRRVKRRWISAVFKLIEEDPGPYPKMAIKLSNDRSLNYTLLFSISGEGVNTEPEKGLFTIDAKTGEIFVHRKVDREKTKELTFQVDALNRDTLKAVDDHMLYKIIVVDINDNTPKFSKGIYNVNALENTHPGEEIFKVEANDPDDVRLGNAKLSFSIVSQKPSVPSNMFGINSENGSIFLQKCLDYQAINSYSLVIKVRDNGQKVRSSTAEVQINVIDANNNPPILTQKSVSGVINESDKDVVVLRVSVTDKDTPNTPAWRAKYKIVEGNKDENYKIETDPKTNDGILFLIKSLDYEDGPKRKIWISVENEQPLFTCTGKDSGVLQNISAIITVKDSNDPPMFFPPVLIVKELEGQEPGKILGRFNATDTDKFYKNSIRYARGIEPAEWITVDAETGVITTVKVLDRESPYVNNSVYTFTVYAIDDGEIPSTGTGTMSIFLDDVNDNLPHLVTQYQDMCDEGEVSFITVAAGDHDKDPFSGPFTFELLDNEQHIKDKLKLGKATDSTVQLVREKQIPVGNYSVPFKIRDRQGISQECSLTLRVCHCLDGKTCPTPKLESVALGGIAIGLFVAGLLLLLLALCLLLFCKCTKKKLQYSLPYNEPTWTLINYNEEGGYADNRTAPIMPSSKISSKNTGLGAGSKLTVREDVQAMYNKEDLLRSGGGTMRQGYNFHDWANEDNSENASHVSGTNRSRNASYSYGSKAWGTMKNSGTFPHGGGTFRPTNTSQGHNTWANRQYLELDENYEENKPRVYRYEGEELCAPSLDSISMFEDCTGSDYLNDLGPKFTPLARICQERYPQ